MDSKSTPSILLSNQEEFEQQQVIHSTSTADYSGMTTMTVPPPRLVRQPSINQGYSVIHPKSTGRQDSKPGGDRRGEGGGGATPVGGDWHAITEEFPG